MAADKGGDDVVTIGKLNQRIAGEDITNDVLKTEERFSYTYISTAYDTSGNGNHGTITGATYSTDVPCVNRSAV